MSLADLFEQLSLLIGTPAVVLMGIGAALVVVTRDWRLTLLAYTIASLMLALLLSQLIPSEWALQQAIVGGLIAVMLFLSARQLHVGARSTGPWERRWPRMTSLTSFRVLAVGLATVVFFVLHERIVLPQLDPLFRDALVWLALMGFLGLALHEEPLHAGLSLLLVLGGSQLLLFALIQRRMLIGMLQGGQVLLGLAIAYLVVARGLAAERSAPVDRERGEL